MTDIDVDALLKRARERLGGVAAPMMRGDNLAITLCSHFDNPDQEEDEQGWTPDAITGCDEVLDAIHQHYVSAWNTRAQSAPAPDDVLRNMADDVAKILNCNDEPGGPGILDCIDNAGKPYQSQHLADALFRLHAAIAAYRAAT